jgi:hypothetical protein
MEDVGIFYVPLCSRFYGYLVYFIAIGYILWLLGIFYGHLIYFMAIWFIS